MVYYEVEDNKRIFPIYFNNIFDNPKWPIFNLDQKHLYPEEHVYFGYLVMPFTIEEIKEAVDSFKGDKSLGPNGFTMCFYQHFWDLVKDDMFSLFQ